MVYDDVDHEVHSLGMKSGSKRLEVVGCAKLVVEVCALGAVSELKARTTYSLGSKSSTRGRPNSSAQSRMNQAQTNLSKTSGTADVLNNRTDPDSVEAHTLYIVELVLDTLPCSTAVLFVVGRARGRGSIGESESVRDDLVD